MKNLILISFVLLLSFCEQSGDRHAVEDKSSSLPIIGTWKLVYGSIEQNDTLEVKDLSKSEFIKIINESHFAFFNQTKGSDDDFYGGAGKYKLTGENYVETLDYLKNAKYRGYEFPFTVEIKGDTLIQKGLEEVPEEGIKRYIVEKYLRIN